MPEAVIVGAVRTAVGKGSGKSRALENWRSDDLLAHALKDLVFNKTKIDPMEIEDVVTGCVTQTSEQGLNIGRVAVLAAGLPTEIPGVSLNRQCGSGLQAANFAAQGVMSGMQDVVIGAGVENMTRTVMMSDAEITEDDEGNPTIKVSNQVSDRYHIVSQGISAELIAERWGQTRQQLDEFSLESHKRADQATKNGYFEREIVPVPIKENGNTIMFKQDQGIRADTSVEKLGKLRPAFKPDGGLITAGNSSQLSDGAAAVMITNPDKADQLGLKPRARFVSMGLAAVDPTIMLTAPMPASKKALKKAKLTIDDMDVIEVNEAFAPVPLAFMHDMKADYSKVNKNGGAIALGHPLGATGTKLLTQAVHELERINGTYGLITLCIGFGQGIATIIERIK
ncbi:MAG: thiolase family protein [Candidatus Hodarchaeales archaeon]|jgi:acetyl-CoA C-acetyltransferase